ncbi:PhzF family phenazine biosynthesis protein [Clostridium coskatii]|uniref:Trans-2,3-dihydro-3-hydroxyanthranilate isomerase n=1 Tax=Clostridium coskatii TaxID=1705578 RepID=A0A166UR39_9CLOT|nr:PhzF family phenazine biosynthesis protein [Clostridium coskatii]OAA95151.1 Trans-2,3-dihydro-3-hydroxyanthranilate isomerase [Clostridium coskatii]OBR97501.1 trans-2,3-dihydro-3-hydroxyanthranilate isomerase [Clostridium coskatii]
MKYYVADAFTDEVFKGNPAGVCVLDEWLQDDVMQKIAAENNLSETAFVVKGKNKNEYDLRWFTPKAEIDLCGHATLGTSYVISNYVDVGTDKMIFHTASGILEVNRKSDLYEMNFPTREPKKTQIPETILDIIGVKPIEIYLSRDLFTVVETEEQVKNLAPDFSKMLKLEVGSGVIVTAKGSDVDFVSRCFYPKLGVNEDPVTGSAHSNLIPFWSKRLNKDKMIAKQLSKRGGTLYCELCGDRVKISGRASLYMVGNINI